MDLTTRNQCLLAGNLDEPGILPHVSALGAAPYVFDIDFGLKVLPVEPGILMIRGARQYGKSTWLEQQLQATIQEFGRGTAFYLNGDFIADVNQLEQEIVQLLPHFLKDAAVKRIFIDEITAIPHWEKALKRLSDNGYLNDVLLITTGSKATDLRRGSEKLPGRKGKLPRSSYLFTPLPFSEFKAKCGQALKEDTLIAYLLSGGSPIACSELATKGVIPEYVIELVRDWIEGEITATGRTRAALLNIMRTLFRFGVTPVGQMKLARESGLSNNTVAANYVEILQDLGCVTPAYPWDVQREILVLRKPCKFHFINLLAAIAYHPTPIRSCQDFRNLSEAEQGIWYEWLIAQELQRRRAMEGILLEPLAFWQTKAHELDFVLDEKTFIEVKRGKCTSLEFSWFLKQLPNKKLVVVNKSQFDADAISGVALEDFLG